MQPYQNVIPAKHLVNLPHYYWKRDIFTGHRGTLILERKKKEGSCIKCHQTKRLINGKSCSLLTISQSVNTSGVLEPPAAFLYLSPTSQACLFNMQVGWRFRTRRVTTTAWKRGGGESSCLKSLIKASSEDLQTSCTAFQPRGVSFPFIRYTEEVSKCTGSDIWYSSNRKLIILMRSIKTKKVFDNF